MWHEGHCVSVLNLDWGVMSLSSLHCAIARMFTDVIVGRKIMSSTIIFLEKKHALLFLLDLVQFIFRLLLLTSFLLGICPIRFPHTLNQSMSWVYFFYLSHHLHFRRPRSRNNLIWHNFNWTKIKIHFFKKSIHKNNFKNMKNIHKIPVSYL